MSNRAKELDFFKVKAKIVQYQGKAQKEKAFLQTEFEKSIFSKLCCELQVCKYFPFSAQTACFSTLEVFSFTFLYFLSLFFHTYFLTFSLPFAFLSLLLSLFLPGWHKVREPGNRVPR